MKKITQRELDKKIKSYQEWLNNINEGERLVLNGYDLSSLNLVGVNLKYAEFNGSGLSCTSFFNSDLKYADLGNANLSSADFEYVNLEVAYLHNSNLSYANLDNATLINSNMSDSNLSHTIFRRANLFRANLSNCKLDNTKLSQANTNQVYGLDLYSIDNIGTFNGKVTYIPSIDTVYAGCWTGTLNQLLERGLDMNKGSKKETENIKLAYQFFKNNSN